MSIEDKYLIEKKESFEEKKTALSRETEKAIKLFDKIMKNSQLKELRQVIRNIYSTTNDLEATSLDIKDPEYDMLQDFLDGIDSRLDEMEEDWNSANPLTTADKAMRGWG